VVNIDWKNGKLAEALIKSEIGGNCRLRTLQKVKVVEADAKPVNGANPNRLTQLPYKPLYQNNAKSSLQSVPVQQNYVVDFKTEKGKTYKIIPL
jgi:alpha-L-fucosidase 2